MDKKKVVGVIVAALIVVYLFPIFVSEKSTIDTTNWSNTDKAVLTILSIAVVIVIIDQAFDFARVFIVLPDGRVEEMEIKLREDGE